MISGTQGFMIVKLKEAGCRYCLQPSSLSYEYSNNSTLMISSQSYVVHPQHGYNRLCSAVCPLRGEVAAGALHYADSCHIAHGIHCPGGDRSRVAKCCLRRRNGNLKISRNIIKQLCRFLASDDFLRILILSPQLFFGNNLPVL